MEGNPKNDRHRTERQGVLGGGSAARTVAVVTGAVAVGIVVWIALTPADETVEPAAVQPPRREIQAASTGGRGAAVRVRKSAAADSKRRAGIRPPAAPAGEHGDEAGREAAVGQAPFTEEEVIENEPGQEYPRGVDAGPYIEKLREMGETEGIAAFGLPGTDPPKAGVVVPDDYALPEGYERYYQYTDDGKRLEPILLFSPEYEFYDADGNQLPVPEDRVVPPDQVPSDLPVQMLDPKSPGETGELIQRSP